MAGIKEVLKNSSHKLALAAESKKETVLNSIANSSATIVALKWAATHWVTLVLVSLLLGLYGKYRYDKYILEDTIIRQEIANLNISLEDLRKQREELLSKITLFNKQIEEARNQNNLIRKDAATLSTEDKRKKILDYTTRLLAKRGIK